VESIGIASWELGLEYALILAIVRAWSLSKTKLRLVFLWIFSYHIVVYYPTLF
jgi:hypothetical protein